METPAPVLAVKYWNAQRKQEDCWEINPCTVAFLILTYVKDTTAENSHKPVSVPDNKYKLRA